MNTVNVGPFHVLKALPENTQLMAAWGATWTFGTRVQIGGRYVKPLPVIRNGEFFISRDPLHDLSIPDTEAALVLEVRTIERAQRTSQKTFPAVRHHAIANIEGKAWMLASTDYWKTARFTYSTANSDKVALPNANFFLPDLIGEPEFKKMVLELKSIVKKL